jgi:hypothetical protein
VTRIAQTCWIAHAAWTLAVLLMAEPAGAQERRPISVAAFEIRGVTGSLPADAMTADDLGLSGDLPARVWGGVAGLHVFPVRREGFALGLGGEGLWARTGADIVDAAGNPTGRRIVRHLQGLAGIVSLNFGHEGGWSHVSAGVGPLEYTSSLSPAPPPVPSGGDDEESAYAWTLNAGGGARWFLARHVGVGFDVRFYLTRAAPQTATSAGRETARVVLISVGMTIK